MCFRGESLNMTTPLSDGFVGFVVGFPTAGDRELQVRQALGALLEVQVRNIE
jgi:hypothetical protein